MGVLFECCCCRDVRLEPINGSKMGRIHEGCILMRCPVCLMSHYVPAKIGIMSIHTVPNWEDLVRYYGGG
jgi:hypothetical protein